MRNDIAALLVCWLGLPCAAQEKAGISPERVNLCAGAVGCLHPLLPR